MNAGIHFIKNNLTEKTSINYGVGKGQREVLIDKIIIDYMNEHYHSELKVEQLIELIMLENIHYIEQQIELSQKGDAIEDYLVNAIGASLLNVTPIAHNRSQVIEMKFEHLVFQCGKVVSKTIKIPQFIISMMREVDIVRYVEKEVANINAADFNFRLFTNFIRGVLLAKLFEHKIEADNWVH